MSSEETTGGLRGWPGAVVRHVLRLLPAPIRAHVLRRREELKFLIVGGACFVVTVVINYALKLTVLGSKPVTALTIATIIGTMLSYVLNREWAFRSRGGRERHHEAAWFFGINAVATAITTVPMLISRYVFDLRVPDVSRLVQEISDFTAGIVLGTLFAMGFRLWAYRKWVFPQQNVRLVRTNQENDQRAA